MLDDILSRGGMNRCQPETLAMFARENPDELPTLLKLYRTDNSCEEIGRPSTAFDFFEEVSAIRSIRFARVRYDGVVRSWRAQRSKRSRAASWLEARPLARPELSRTARNIWSKLARSFIGAALWVRPQVLRAPFGNECH